MPYSWFTRWTFDGLATVKDTEKWQYNITSKYKKVTGNDYIYLGGEFHPDIKMVHFTHSMNKPHLWKEYEQHI